MIYVRKFLWLFSHFLQIHGFEYFYTIGGWDIDFLSSVHRIKIDPDKGEPKDGAKWEDHVPSLKQNRGDHACDVITYVHDDVWETGIIVAGGYSSIGAWTNKVEFFNFETGTYYWIQIPVHTVMYIARKKSIFW